MNSPGLSFPEFPATRPIHELRISVWVELALTDDGVITALDNERDSDLDKTRQEINVVCENDYITM